MSRIKYDFVSMRFMSLFESVTGAKLKDCIMGNELVTFIVEENQIGKAIGKAGINVRKLERALNRKIKIVEFSSEILRFVQKAIYPLTVKDIKEENGTITIFSPDAKTKGLLIGRDKQNLNSLKEMVARFFDVNEIKIM